MRATLWQSGAAYDLNSLIAASSGWTLLQAWDINNLGDIVGVGINPHGALRGYVLTPVSEPASAILMLAALAVVQLRRAPTPGAGRIVATGRDVADRRVLI